MFNVHVVVGWLKGKMVCRMRKNYSIEGKGGEGEGGTQQSALKIARRFLGAEGGESGT